MEDNSDYRKLIETMFEGVHMKMNAHFHNVDEKLESIEKQTIKTNSRVTHLEENVHNLAMADVAHVLNCPAMPKIQAIQDNLLEYNVFKKYPKGGIIIFVVLVLISLFGIIKMDKISNKVDNTQVVVRDAIHDQEGVSKVTRGDYVKYNDGGLSDSIKLPFPR